MNIEHFLCDKHLDKNLSKNLISKMHMCFIKKQLSSWYFYYSVYSQF